MNMNDTYAVIKYRGKPQLAFVLNTTSRFAVLNESLHNGDPVNFQYREDQVLCWLGANPPIGSVYGVKVEPYHKTIETRLYGPIHFFRELDKPQIKALKYAMLDVYNLFKTSLSVDFLPVYSIHIKNKRGKYAGSYRASSSGGQAKDTITFHPHDFSDEAFNRYLVAHEFAHGLWFRCVPHKLRAKWLKLYEKRMKLNLVNQDQLSDLLSSILAHETGFDGYIREVADDFELMILREVMSYMKRHYKLNKDNIQLLMEFDSEFLGRIWPTIAHLTEKRSDISQYAMTRVEEFFAEAVAFYVTGRSISEDVEAALAATVKRL